MREVRLLLVLLGLLAGAWHATAMATMPPAAAPQAPTVAAMADDAMVHADCHDAAGTDATPGTDGHTSPGCCDGDCRGGCLVVADLPLPIAPDLPVALPTRYALVRAPAPPAGLPPALFHPPRAFA